jgi:Zn-dependent protease
MLSESLKGVVAQTLQYAQAVRPPDPLALAIAKTAGSMLFSAIVYYFFLFQNVVIAVGFVVLMLIHEMGHVFAMRYYGLSASPPIFIPFVGAMINMRQRPANALVESVVGMGGPLLGTSGALACYFVALNTHGQALRLELLIVAQLAFMLNLFNLLPVPPLDGGRITAAISPWLWLPGLAGLGVLMFREIREGGTFGVVILGLVLFYAIPRIRMTLKARGMKLPYYEISRGATIRMGTLYICLGAVLVYVFHFALGGTDGLMNMLNLLRLVQNS